jgi:hypothetical protein
MREQLTKQQKEDGTPGKEEKSKHHSYSTDCPDMQ